jgi:hypothetical protein
MIILAKCALALSSTIVVAGVYTFHEGVIKVDVDESRSGGSHVHFWLPAAAVPMAMHLVPKRHFREIPAEASECLPLLRIVTSELRRYPDTTFVDVQDGRDHVRVATVGSKIQIDVVNSEENVHIAVPLSTVNDVANQLAADAPGV